MSFSMAPGQAGHNYGYTNFYVDITKYVDLDEQHKILVTIDNSEELSSRWYLGSGINRPVSLFIGGRYIASNRVKSPSRRRIL